MGRVEFRRPWPPLSPPPESARRPGGMSQRGLSLFPACPAVLLSLRQCGDGKGMQAMGGAGSECWLCKGIFEQMGVESTSRWGAFLRCVTPHRQPGDYQHAACRILNGIAKRTETTLQALPHGTPGKAPALAALQAFKQALKDETSSIPLRERLPSASRAEEKDLDPTSTKVFLTSPPFQRQFVDCLKEHVPSVRTPGGPPLWVVVHVMVKCIEGLYELWRVREMYTGTPPCVDHKVLESLGRLRLVPHQVDPLVLGTFHFFC